MNLRVQIFLITFALGILPLLTLVGVNLSGHIKRHEKVGQQQTEVRQQLELVNINSEISHYRQTLAVIIRLPEVRRIVNTETTIPPSKELTDLLNSWLSANNAIEELIVTDHKNRTKLSLLRTDDIFSPRHSEEIGQPFHNQFNGAKEFFLSTTASTGNKKISASLRVDAELFLPGHLNTFWITPGGDYLRQPYMIKLTTTPGTNAFEDFPQLQPALSLRRSVLWESASNYTVAWMPILLNGLRPALWVGSPIDQTGALKWKRSLIQNIVMIIMIMSAIIFFIANTIAKKIDSIKEQILLGLDQVLNKDKDFRFTWTGPREITTMAEDLSRLAQRYIKTSRARHEAEIALHENQENFRNLTNSAQDAIVLMDHHGNISYWNQTAEEMFGYRRNEAIGKPIHSLISPQLIKGDSRESINIRTEGEGPIRETIELTTQKKERCQSAGRTFPFRGQDQGQMAFDLDNQGHLRT